ncbi:unnamed protein product [Penicillium viridicatum]
MKILLFNCPVPPKMQTVQTCFPEKFSKSSTPNTSSSQPFGRSPLPQTIRVLDHLPSLASSNPIQLQLEEQPPAPPPTMAPSHLLRATMPLRASITTPLSLTRPSILQSTTYLTTPLRNASTTTPTPTQPKTTGTETQAPSQLRNYASALKTGTVVSVGRMDRTVRVCHRHTSWDRHIRKFYPQETHYLVSDPRNSLRDGDIIEFSSGAPKSRNVHHVVERIVTPFGAAIEDRPAVLSKAEREAERETRWAAKYLRRESKRLGREVDLVKEAAKAGVPVPNGEVLSTAQLIHRIHAENERVGKVKRIVQERVAESERVTQERMKEAEN